MAVTSGVEYELQKAGKATGVYDVFGSDQVDGAWRGFGVWKPISSSSAAASKSAVNSSSLYAQVDINDDDTPTLKRKHPKGTDLDDDDPAKPKSKAGESAEADTKKAPVDDADSERPTLRRKKSADSASAEPGAPQKTESAPSRDTDPDRPTIRRSRKAAEAGMLETSSAAPDPDRPRLKHGKPAELEETTPTRLAGSPPSMQQAVAVSDMRNRPEHPWRYTWANPADEEKMKAALEGIARTALGLDLPPVPAKPVRKTAAKRKITQIEEPPEPVELAEEQFRVYELAYGSTATLVLTAATPKPEQVTTSEPAKDETPLIRRGKPTAKVTRPEAETKLPPKPAPQKFVTLVAQPDLYGGVLVLFKSVTDSAHLDETPRFRLVDAVDAMGDNRGELLFEMRGDQQRQFALYRVLRGSAERMFATVAVP